MELDDKLPPHIPALQILLYGRRQGVLGSTPIVNSSYAHAVLYCWCWIEIIVELQYVLSYLLFSFYNNVCVGLFHNN